MAVVVITVLHLAPLVVWAIMRHFRPQDSNKLDLALAAHGNSLSSNKKGYRYELVYDRDRYQNRHQNNEYGLHYQYKYGEIK
jgi:hypothetical protein